jgi:putative ABC transport system permease protein
MSGEAVRIPNNPQSHIMNFYISDEDNLKTMGFKLLSGRFFSKNFPSDSNAVVINEAAMRDMSWKNVDLKEFAADADIRYKVVGAISDFNYQSLRSEIKPLLIFYSPNPGNTLNIRFSGITPNQMIKILEKYWHQYGNGEPFDYNFLDQDFDSLFKAESRVGKLLTVFSIGIIVISCLGLFALSSFIAEKRRHEIGIRKVMGASVSRITALLSIQFIKLVTISFLCSLIPTYFMSKKWLEGFAFHHGVNYVPFLIAGVVVLFISLITVSYHSVKAALLNPVNTLRSE